MDKPMKIVMILTVTLHFVQPLSIEHPHSYSLFKRGVVLGDLTYSYAATDMGSNNGRVKTVTVIKNVSLPKPTSTIFSDRSEQFFETFDLTGGKKHEQVQYWPADDTNKLKRVTNKPPSINVPATKEQPKEEFKHPAELLEIARSAAKAYSNSLKSRPSKDTGPVVFPPDAQTMKKKHSGVIGVAKEYTSILTNDQEKRAKPKTASKLNTKVQPTKTNEPELEDVNPFDSPIFRDFQQTEYVYSPETNTYILKEVSKPSKEIKYKIENTPYAYKDPSQPNDSAITTYNDNGSIPDLLFSELANAVASRNISMIKALAAQLGEQYDFQKYEFESQKTEAYVPMSYDASTSSSKAPSDPEPSTEKAEKMDISDEISTTVEEPSTTTKRPKYIAPRLRGIKRFSSRKV
ncbi:uncharacterized protein LOC129765290 [Toxorhynchites rutilus septentrionalis]|uniref:uncharacterized protein LOC129765290 n=1 Tax=Toxorhynchites rutilus septentrionalis TaxID=329112 RepID=UPI0024792AC8|nr:uncharacterized protein LOC129765290 [Toxorhynchites rutilus septentrionalis]